MLRNTYINILIIALIVGISYNLIYLPSDIRRAKVRKDYLAQRLYAHISSKAHQFEHYAYYEIGIDTVFTFHITAIEVNLVRNEYEIRLEMRHPDHSLKINDTVLLEKFEKLFDRFPDLMMNDFKGKEKYIFSYRCERPLF